MAANLRIRTHIVFLDGRNCVLCGTLIPTLQQDGHEIPLKPGQRIGIIESRLTPPTSYAVGEKDSNFLCNYHDEAAA